MQKKIYTILLGLLLVVFLTACQEKGEGQGAKDSVLPPVAPVEVEFSVDPATDIKPSQPVQLQVLLTQAGEVIEDADLVRFEIWHEDDQEEDQGSHSDADEEDAHHDHSSMEHHESDNEMVTAEHIGGGVYAYEYQFEKSGVYYVMYHVDARDYHMMTANEVIVE